MRISGIILILLCAVWVSIYTAKPYICLVTLNCILLHTFAKSFRSKETSVFSPSVFLTYFGLYILGIAPILLDFFDYRMLFSSVIIDHEQYLSTWAFHYTIGLSIMLLVSKVKFGNGPATTWIVDQRTFIFWWLVFLFATGSLQAFIYYKFGGISGYIDLYTSGLSRKAFRGYGIVFLFSESFPIIYIIGIAYLMRNKQISKHWLIPHLLMYAALLLLFGGLRGSRSMFIFRLYMGAGILHFSGMKIKRWLIVSGVVFTLSFIVLYKAIYKNSRYNDGKIVMSDVFQSQLGQFILITDLSRVDVQTLLIHQLEHNEEYQLAQGGTYASGLLVMFPTAIYKAIFSTSKPPSKTKEGTDLIRGPNSFARGEVVSYVFGMLGEALLNFGTYFAVIVFVFFGFVISNLNKFFAKLATEDSRRVLLPILAVFNGNIFQGDFDNIIFFSFKMGLIPLLLIFLSSKKLRYEK